MLRQTAHIAVTIALSSTVTFGTAGAFVTPGTLQPTTGPCCSAG